MGLLEGRGSAYPKSEYLSPVLRGDASASCNCPVEPEQVLGRVVAVERAGRPIDLASRRAKVKHTCRVWASRVVRWLQLKSLILKTSPR